LRKEHRLRVFEKRVLRRIFGSKRDGVTEGWRKLHNEELHNLYSSPNKIRIIKSRRMRWAGHVARLGGEGHIWDFGENAEGKKPLGKPRRRWEDNNKINLGGIGWGGMDCIDMGQDRDHGGLLHTC
jgi:hypothetical protein